MASNISTNTGFNGQYTCFSFLGFQCGTQAQGQRSFSTVPSIFSEITTDSLVSPNWNTTTDIQVPIKPFTDFEISISNEDTDSVSSSSNLLQSSKKISKSSSQRTTSQKGERRRPNRRRNDWKPQEDTKLLELMKEYGQCWAMISSKLPGRTGKQVRDRYVNNLAPGIKCGNWTPEEDNLILNLRNENGNKWSLIASHLPGRTEAQVKNRFYSYIKKKSENLQSTGNTVQAHSYQELDSVSSSITSPQIEVDSDQGTVEGEATFDCTNLLESSTVFALEDVDVQSAGQISSCMVTTVSSLGADEDKSSYGNVIRIPCFTGRPECLSQPLENPFVQKFHESSINQPTQNFSGCFIENDSQVDELLNHAVDCMESSESLDVDKYFAEDLKKENEEFQMLSEIEYKPSERELELRTRKAYLESMLQAVLKEMQEL